MQQPGNPSGGDAENFQTRAARLVGAGRRAIERRLAEIDQRPPPAPAEPDESSRPGEDQSGVERRLTEAVREKEAAERELLEARRAADEERERSRELAARIELLEGREAELRSLLLQAHEQLLRRDGELARALAAAEASLSAAAPPEAKPLPPPESVAAGAAYVAPEPSDDASGLLPAGAVVLVAGEDEAEFIRLNGCSVWRFPRNADGTYAGPPPDAATAIQHIEELRALGAEYFLLPAVCYWWLDYYSALAGHLDRYPRVVEGPREIVWQLA